MIDRDEWIKRAADRILMESRMNCFDALDEASDLYHETKGIGSPEEAADKALRYLPGVTK